MKDLPLSAQIAEWMEFGSILKKYILSIVFNV